MTIFGLSKTDIDQIKSVFVQYPEIEKAVLYGSRAKGNYSNGSDIDLTLIGNGISLTILNKIDTDLDELLLPYTFDLSIYRHIDNKGLVGHIDRMGKPFYLKNHDDKDY